MINLTILKQYFSEEEGGTLKMVKDADLMAINSKIWVALYGITTHPTSAETDTTFTITIES